MSQILPDVLPEVEPDTLHEPSPPSFVPPPTRSGQAHKFPVLFKDFLPNSTSRIPVPHMPLRHQALRAAAMTAQPELPYILPVIAEESATKFYNRT